MRNHVIAGMAATLMLTVGSAALAQGAPNGQGDNNQPSQQIQLPPFPQPEWSKVCAQTPAGKDICQTVRDLLTPAASWTMTVQVNQEKGGKPNLTVIIPAGMVLPRGARVLVDGQTIDTAKYRICFGPTCAADMPLSDANLATFKKGKKMTVQAIAFSGQSVALDIGLDGFGKVFDGNGLTTDEFKTKQQAYGESLQKIFQPLIDAQQKAQQQQGGGAGAPPAQPAPAQ